MHAEDGSDVHRERAVDVDRDVGDLAGAGEPVQAVDQLLGPAHRERGDQHLAPARRGAPDRLAQALLRAGAPTRGRRSA